jgi:AcrR family transcriptional regulator
LLDSGGEGGLTFQALSKRLATGPGAIYWHVTNKSDLLTASCDAIVAKALNAASTTGSPEEALRRLALGMFDIIDEHPWVGSSLNLALGQLPMVRIFDRVGQHIRALGVPAEKEWTTASALVSYILGVGGQNAANAQMGRQKGLDRTDFLGEASKLWSQLDSDEYPFVSGIASQLSTHDDRADFLAGIDFILVGIADLI